MLPLDVFTYRWRLKPRGEGERRNPEEEVLGRAVCLSPVAPSHFTHTSPTSLTLLPGSCKHKKEGLHSPQGPLVQRKPPKRSG